MINVAIVEDEKAEAKELSDCLDRYGLEHGETFKATHFVNPMNFLSEYKPVYDIVFMDIQMPLMDGMKAAELLRKKDPSVILVFVTNLMQYAVKGYSVEALDFIVKPIKYSALSLTLLRCMEKIRSKSGKVLSVRRADGFVNISVRDITYIEIVSHRITVHTVANDVEFSGSLSDIERKLSGLSGEDFCRCNSCYIVNLRYVEKAEGQTVTVAGKELSVSKPRKKELVSALKKYSQGGA